MTAPKINVYPADLGGCGMYRCVWPGQELERQGAGVHVVMPADDDQLQAFWTDNQDGTRTLVDVRTPDCDVVVLQRPLKDTLVRTIPMLQARGVKVVVEVDDNFDAISRRNVSWPTVDPTLSPERNRAHLRQACELADMVVVTTPALAAHYGRHGRVAVVPNCVPSWYLALERDEHEGVFVGWSGGLNTHPDDLQVTKGGVARALKATGAKMAVVGTGRGVGRALGLAEPPLAVGWLPIGRYPRAVAQFDIGIVPLEMTPFNQAKSALKMMEMAATGVVPVVSPTEDNLRMYEQGIGIPVASPRAWEGAIKGLVRYPDSRAYAAARGREAMRRHTIEGNADRWWDAWSSVVNTPLAA